MTITIVALSGSLRRESFNTKLLGAARERLPDDTQLIIESIAAIPLYNFDDEAANGIPLPVTRLKNAIAEGDGLLIASPEYNNAMPGVLKNAIDWLSRPPDDIKRVFGSRPTALIGTSPGAFGTILAQNSWLPVLRTLGVSYWTGGRLIVPRASQLFDERGVLTDEGTGNRLKSFLDGFAGYIRNLRSTDRQG